MRRLMAVGAAAFTLAAGCQAMEPGLQPTMPRLTRQLVGRPAYLETGAASTQPEFTDLLSRAGVHLNTTQIKAVGQATTVLPNGRWAPGGEASLQDAWTQYGRSVTPAFTTPEQFLAAAVSFARKRDAGVGFYFDAEHFRLTGEVRVPRWEPQQGQFIDLQADGGVSLYKPKAAEPPMSYVRVPQEMMPGAR
jgi:hypothetical protein